MEGSSYLPKPRRSTPIRTETFGFRVRRTAIMR